MHPFVVGPDFKQSDGEDVATGLQFLAVADFISLLDRRPRSKESLQAIFRNLMLGGIGEQNDSRLVVLSLPGGQEVVGGAERGHVLAIGEARRGVLAFCR